MARPKGLPKSGGRRRGTPNRVAHRERCEIKDFARAVLQDPAYQASLVTRIRDGKAPHMEALLHHYAYGVPKQPVEMSGELATETTIVHEHRRS
ncbi:MAG: hypothetical protein NUW01_15735 [Gemmatimonadaceae bacterium]|nr:hypothetical protein [Gemmatimonadaceae bacterium]